MSIEKLRREWSERPRLQPAGTIYYDLQKIMEKYGEPVDAETDFGVIRKVTLSLDEAPRHGSQILEIKEIVDPTDFEGASVYMVVGGSDDDQSERYVSQGVDLDIDTENSLLADLGIYIDGAHPRKWRKSTRTERKELKKRLQAEGYSAEEIAFFVQISKNKKLRKRLDLET